MGNSLSQFFKGWSPQKIAAFNAKNAPKPPKSVKIPPAVILYQPQITPITTRNLPSVPDPMAPMELPAAQTSPRMCFTVKGLPMGAPRQTGSDRWKKRDCVVRYHAYRDLIRAGVGVKLETPYRADLVFYFPMPNGWSKKKKLSMNGQLHQSKPDIDNCFKSVTDALFENDSAIAVTLSSKRWCWAGEERTEMTFCYPVEGNIPT